MLTIVSGSEQRFDVGKRETNRKVLVDERKLEEGNMMFIYRCDGG